MKQHLMTLGLMMAILGCCQDVKAYDFEAVCPSGQTLYYEITSSDKVSVGKPGQDWSGHVKPVGALEIPSTVTYNGTEYRVTAIMNCVFEGCDSITSIIIPNTIKDLGYGTFSQCSRLTTVNIPMGVTAIGHSIFEDCSSLTDIHIPTTITAIEAYAFQRCSSLRRIVIPYSVTTIDAWAFAECSSLDSAYIGSAVTYIGQFAFENCTSLTHVTIGNAVTRIYQKAFHNCRNLVSVKMGSSISRIDWFAFEGCAHLQEMTLPASLTYIEAYPFLGCEQLPYVRLLGAPPTIRWREVFVCDSSNGEEFTVIVPCEYDSLYRTAEIWQDLQHLQNDCNESVSELTTATEYTLLVKGDCLCVAGAANRCIRFFDSMGRLLHTVPSAGERCEFRVPTAGVYIVRVDQDAARKVVVLR